MSSLIWFRQDLRLSDNKALAAAAKFKNVFAVFAWNEKTKKIGQNSSWWLHQSLTSLNKDLKNKLNVYNESPEKIISKLCKQNKIEKVFWNRSSISWKIAEEKKVAQALKKINVEFESFNSNYLVDPENLLTKSGGFYKVYTPFFKALKSQNIKKPLNKLNKIVFKKDESNKTKIENLNLLKKDKKATYAQLKKMWKPGEANAKKKLANFINKKLSQYANKRDIPSLNSTSLLSAHFAHGEISPNQAWHASLNSKASSANKLKFCQEIAWRDFCSYLLYHFPDLHKKNFQPKFDKFKWESNSKHLKAWKEGKTGFPIIDAGMRELVQTGTMHNRIRMVTASFLTKNLLIKWQSGEEFFWQNLVDADLASNSFNWQWVAGSGADAAPFFRIFNPVLQTQKFDPEGEYIKKFVPELKLLPKKFIAQPWKAPAEVLKKAKIQLKKDYPLPVVDLDKTRKQALDLYKKI